MPVEAEPEPATAVEQAAGDVQQPVAQCLWLGSGQGRKIVQEDRLGPGEQVGGEHDGGQPGGVDGERPAGEAAQAGVCAGAEAVLDPGVGAVAGVEEGQLPDCGVGGEAWVAPAVAVFEGVQLGAGVRPFGEPALGCRPDSPRMS